MDNIDRVDLIVSSFEAGYTVNEMCAWLRLAGIQLSARQVKRILKSFGLKRRQISDNRAVVEAIIGELQGNGICLGYRSMHHRLKTRLRIHVPMHTVRELLLELDPEGVDARRRHRLHRRQYRNKGPLFSIHVDGYDKLKPYGFAIHGAIDGFSRRILWLRVGRTNNNPDVVAGYFLDFLKAEMGTARTIRVDAGTENVTIQDMQMAIVHQWDLRQLPRCFIIGRSVSNQRIERLWGTLRTQCIQYFIDLFNDMVESGLYNKYDEIQCECLRFCFMTVIQQNLNHMAEEWNNHRLQRSRQTEMPCGKPNLMYSFPELYGGQHFKIPVTQQDCTQMEHLVCRDTICSDDYMDIFSQIMQAKNFHPATDSMMALTLYGELLHAFGY